VLFDRDDRRGHDLVHPFHRDPRLSARRASNLPFLPDFPVPDHRHRWIDLGCRHRGSVKIAPRHGFGGDDLRLGNLGHALHWYDRLPCAGHHPMGHGLSGRLCDHCGDPRYPCARGRRPWWKGQRVVDDGALGLGHYPIAFHRDVRLSGDAARRAASLCQSCRIPAARNRNL
jgi:hypothetical protein